LKKRNKKLLFFGQCGRCKQAFLEESKVFWFFFSKKNYFPYACLRLAVSRSQRGLEKEEARPAAAFFGRARVCRRRVA
jgi:hypothetical protein